MQYEKKKGSSFHRRSSSPPLVNFGLRVHDDLSLSLLFLDLLGVCHVLDTHFLIDFPLSPSSLISRVS